MEGPIIKVAALDDDEDNDVDMKLAYLAYDMNTSKGQEGAPVRMKYDDGYYTIGVHTDYDLIVGDLE